MRGGSNLWSLVLVAVGLAASGGAALGADAMRVMTFNIRYGTADDGADSWNQRKDLVVETIRAFQPDLLGTQEVLAMQADYLSEQLTDYTLVGVGRDDGQRRGEFSAILYKTKRFEALESGTFWLSETIDVPGSKSWDSSLPRIVTWVKLRDREAGGREICYLNTHWDHRGVQARVEAGGIMRRWLDEHARGLPTIVTGDFNVNEGHQGLMTVLAKDRDPALVDVYRAVHPESQADESTAHGFTGRKRGRRIDFILATPTWRPVDASIDHTNREGHYPSDHYPVTAVLEYVP